MIKLKDLLTEVKNPKPYFRAKLWSGFQKAAIAKKDRYFYNDLVKIVMKSKLYPHAGKTEITLHGKIVFTKAFDDEGDVPRYRRVGGAPKAGVVVYDKDGNSYSGWDPVKEFGLDLYDIGKDQEDGSIIKDYKAARKPINSKIAPGKPNILGQTSYEGGSGAIAIIIAAPSFDIFAETFDKFSQMFTDIPEFAATTGKGLLDSLNEVLTPANTVIKLTQVDSNYGLFEAGDIIGGQI